MLMKRNLPGLTTMGGVSTALTPPDIRISYRKPLHNIPGEKVWSLGKRKDPNKGATEYMGVVSNDPLDTGVNEITKQETL